MKPTRGGSRPGSGRPTTGKVSYMVRVLPATVKAIEHLAKVRGCKVSGEVLDGDYQKRKGKI